MPHSIKWNGREVQSPILRKLLVLIMIPFMIVMFFIALLFLFFFALPIMLVTHPILRLLGFNGHTRHDGFKLDHNSFRRRGNFVPDTRAGFVRFLPILIFYALLAWAVWEIFFS